MKRILTNYRYYVLFALAVIATLGIFGVPTDGQPLMQWLYVLVSSKVIGFGAICIAAKLTKRWQKLGTIPELMNAVDNY